VRETMRFDAVIVGAGPAGCMAARDLARAGARVAIVDGSHPREKPCGGGVTARAAALVPRDAVEVESLAQPIDAAVFEAGPKRARVTVPDPGALRIIPRAAFDAVLLQHAVANG